MPAALLETYLVCGVAPSSGTDGAQFEAQQWKLSRAADAFRARICCLFCHDGGTTRGHSSGELLV